MERVVEADYQLQSANDPNTSSSKAAAKARLEKRFGR